MKFPTVHLNGTNGRDLMDQQLDVLHALRMLQQAVANAAPNGRDYYVQEPGAFEVAQSEYDVRRNKLIDLVLDYTAIVDNISEQNDAIEARKKR